MISYQLPGYGQPLTRIEAQPPEPTGTEILMAVEACGVCHSDLHLSDGYFDLGDSRRLDLTKLLRSVSNSNEPGVILVT